MRYFKFIEMVKSARADEFNIDNFPKDFDIIDNIIFTMECLDKIRDEYGLPLYISSGYRCPELNKKVGGKATSQHLKGQAADINLGSIEKNRAFFNWVSCNKDKIDFDQLLDEYGYQWVHISFRKDGKNRKQILHI